MHYELSLGYHNALGDIIRLAQCNVSYFKAIAMHCEIS